MPAGTPVLLDSYWLSQSTVFKGKVQAALIETCNAISNESITGLTGTMPTYLHQQRKSLVLQILSPSGFSNWLTQFTNAASIDTTLIAAATLASTNYTPITSAAGGDTACVNITDTEVMNALSGAFNTFVSGV
jgi:hypothetical protein